MTVKVMAGITLDAAYQHGRCAGMDEARNVCLARARATLHRDATADNHARRNEAQNCAFAIHEAMMSRPAAEGGMMEPNECSPMPWALDQDNEKGLRVVDARGDIVYEEDWGGIPDEMSSAQRERIILQARANARFMIEASCAAINAMPTEDARDADSYPCRVEEIDFEKDRVVLRMIRPGYRLGSGNYVLRATTVASEGKPCT